jgi:hypothetical protein
MKNNNMKYLFLFSFFISAYSFSCDCKTIPNPLNEKVLEQGSHEFFLGTIKSVSKKKEGKISYMEYEITIDKKYTLKDAVQTVKIRTRPNNCLAEFEVGKTYLLSTTRDKEKVRWTDQCHFKRTFKAAKRYMDFLDEKYPG